MDKNDAKKKKFVNAENMRYKVPDVCNRFWQTHTKFILVCLLIAVSVIIVAFSYAVMRTVRRLEPKVSCVFFCEVENYDAVDQAMDKYSPFVDVYFPVYDAAFTAEEDEDGNKKDKYDFSLLGYYMSKDYNNPPEGVLYVVLTTSGKIKSAKTYEETGYADGTAFSAELIESILKEATDL